LLAANADVNVKDGYGATALIYAAQDGYLEVARALIGARADVNYVAPNGATALMVASQNGHQNVVQLLKNAGAVER
jgi:serine/threonine-protein phosphatase 6 regulatory ankyrin repeat subunit B